MVGTGQLLIIALVVVLLFGTKYLPWIGRTLGRGVGQYRRTFGNARQNGPRPTSKPKASEDLTAAAKQARKALRWLRMGR